MRGEHVAILGVHEHPGRGLRARRLLRLDRGGGAEEARECDQRRDGPTRHASGYFSLSVAPEGTACGSICGLSSSMRSTETPTFTAMLPRESPGWTT